MIIAHLPAGYLLTKFLSAKFQATQSRALWLCGLMASLGPDIDILWFHLVDHGLRNHRYYPTHWPLFWAALFLASLLVLLILKRRDLLIFPVVITANIGLHLILDTLAAPIFYAAPFSWAKLQFIQVPSLYHWWVWNFLRHWTFQLELMVWAAAAVVYGLSRWERRTGDL